MPDTSLNAVVTRRIDIAKGVWITQVSPAGWQLERFEPGQYATIGLPGTHARCDGQADDPPLEDREKLIRRDYSIASSPDDLSHLEFYMVLATEGGLSPRLYMLQPGDQLWLSPRISGDFLLSRAPSETNLVLIATGTGVAPYMSMLRTIIKPGSLRRITLLHGVRHSTDLGYHEELLLMQQLSPSFLYIPIVSRPGEEPVAWSGTTGYVQDVWRSKIIHQHWGIDPSPTNTHIYLCGSSEMIDDSVAMFSKEGYREHKASAPGQIHVERYW